jgi:hypothetical protein
MTDGARPVLVVLKDGAPLAEDEARALWTEFSAHMDANRGDMAGFAKQKGWTEVRPEYRKGQAVLIVSTTPEAAAKAAAPPPKPKPAPPKHGGGGGKRPQGKKSGPPKGGKPPAKKA